MQILLSHPRKWTTFFSFALSCITTLDNNTTEDGNARKCPVEAWNLLHVPAKQQWTRECVANCSKCREKVAKEAQQKNSMHKKIRQQDGRDLLLLTTVVVTTTAYFFHIHKVLRIPNNWRKAKMHEPKKFPGVQYGLWAAVAELHLSSYSISGMDTGPLPFKDLRTINRFSVDYWESIVIYRFYGWSSC